MKEVILTETFKKHMVFLSLSRREYEVAICLCSLMNPDTNEVLLTTPKRYKVMEALEMTPSNLSNILAQLIEKGVVEGTKGEYTVNRDYFRIQDTESDRIANGE